MEEKKTRSVLKVKLIDKPIPKPNEGLFPERYKIHQYWSRKPWYVVRRHIEKFTEDGDLVLDPFFGSGVTACETLVLRRRFVGCDLNPIAVLVNKLTCISPIDFSKFQLFFDRVNKISDQINKLYLTECRKCKKLIPITNTIWKNDNPTKIFYDCKECGKKELTKINEFDLANLAEIKKKHVTHWYPKNVKLPKDSDVKYIHELFTKRNLLALSILFNEINHLPNSIEKELVLLMFMSTITRCSKLIFINKFRLSRGVNPAGVWGEKRYWIPDVYIENNVAHYFNARFSKIMKAKKETNSLIGDFFSPNTFQIKNASATNLSFLESNSVDYCFTDPPYGGSIHYMDLSLIWNSWFQKNDQRKEEIVVSKSKSISDYKNGMLKAFREIFRVLKHDRYLSVTFHNSDIEIWNVLLEVCNECGFDLLKVVPQEPSKSSHNQIDMQGNVKTDLVLTFRKPSRGKQITKTNQKVDIQNLVEEIIFKLLDSKKKITTAEIYDHVLMDWIVKTFHNKSVGQFVSLKDLEKILEKLMIRKISETELDYKGEKREVFKWTRC